MKKQIEQVKHFQETMPNLEQMILYYDTSYDDDVLDVSMQLQMLHRVASAKCKIQVISDNLSLSSGKRESPISKKKPTSKRSHQNLVIRKTFYFGNALVLTSLAVMSAAASTRHTSWMVATAIAAVETRWNYPLRFFNKDVRARLRAIAVTSRPPSSASSSSSSSADLVKENHPMPKSEASMERVMCLSCFGPTTVRF
ncbi:putative FBD domain-containing protein [Arabidopsis thaliana]